MADCKDESINSGVTNIRIYITIAADGYRLFIALCITDSIVRKENNRLTLFVLNTVKITGRTNIFEVHSFSNSLPDYLRHEKQSVTPLNVFLQISDRAESCFVAIT